MKSWEREHELIVTGHGEERVALIQKKIEKGKSIEVIAEELETTVEEIKPVYDEVIRHPADTHPSEIVAEMQNK